MTIDSNLTDVTRPEPVYVLVEFKDGDLFPCWLTSRGLSFYRANTPLSARQLALRYRADVVMLRPGMDPARRNEYFACLRQDPQVKRITIISGSSF
jgi:hypothetical protein